MTLPLPSAPDPALLERANQELLNFIEWFIYSSAGYGCDSKDTFECTARKVDMGRAAAQLLDIAEHQEMIFRYWPSYAIEKLEEVLPHEDVPTEQDLIAIDAVYDIAANKNLSRERPGMYRRYNQAFIEWVVDKISNEKNFLKKTRRRFNAMKRNRVSSNDGRRTIVGNARR